MTFTTLRVACGGIPLRDLHIERLGIRPGRVRDAFDLFASTAVPGVYALFLEGDVLDIKPRKGSGLAAGMPWRLLPSPCAAMHGRFPKPASPGPYDAVRMDGVTTLLTTADGSEFLESCRAAVLGWDGTCLVHPPDDRPRVWSTAEQALRLHLPVRAAAIPVDDDMPLLLVNAVAGPCSLAYPGRPTFPADVIVGIGALFATLTLGAGSI